MFRTKTEVFEVDKELPVYSDAATSGSKVVYFFLISPILQHA